MSSKPYRLTKGKHHADGTIYTPGDTVYLTDIQYLAFQDRFLAEEVYHQNTVLDTAIREAQAAAKQAVIDKHEAEQAAIKQKAADDAQNELTAKTAVAEKVTAVKTAVITAPPPPQQKA